MEQLTLINWADQLISQANERCAAGFPDQARAHLVKLRKLLNAQPELEAGSAAETKKTDEASEG